MMMRHWTLYDSMFYSNYLAPRLGIWSESGKKELHRFIALMGIPLDEAKQKYKYMSVKCFCCCFVLSFFIDTIKKQIERYGLSSRA